MIPQPLFAHAFGQSYNLPLPVWLFLYGGAAAVIVSFLVMAVLVDQNRLKTSARVKAIQVPPRLARRLKTLAAYFSIFCLILTIATGWLGTKAATDNFAPTAFWIIFWLGLTYASALLGNFWRFLNPWQNLAALAERSKYWPQQTPYRYPVWLKSWPAAMWLFGLICLEVVLPGFDPRILALSLSLYTLLTLAGWAAFGRVWFEKAEVFNVYFGLAARLAPIQFRENQIILRAPLSGLYQSAVDPSLVWIIVFMLSSTAFDGFRETPRFYSLIQPLGLSKLTLTWALLLTQIGFLGIYQICIAAIKRLVKIDHSVAQLAGWFAPTLIPIAIGYNLAHYWTLLVSQGQLIIPLLSDPFGQGWNLLQTGGYKANIRLITSGFVWYSQVALIVIGHIAAVWSAHVVALKIYSTTNQAIISQYPMLVLMVAYTVTSLWIISQPLR